MSVSTEVQVLHRFDRILSEWQNLLADCPDSTPFQSPAWLLPWWDAFGRGDPIVIVARVRDRLAGLGIFYVYDGDSQKGPQLFFVGKSASDYLDILVRGDEQRAQVAQNIFDRVFDFAEEWRWAELDRLRANSLVLRVKPRAGISQSQGPDGICSELYLNASSIKLIAKKNTRDSIRKHRNRARTFGNVEFVSTEPHTFAPLMDSLIQFHTARWQSSGQPGVFSDPDMIRFLRDAGMRLLDAVNCNCIPCC